MLDRCKQTVLSSLFGCLVGLVVASVVNADGRVFVLDLRNSSGLQDFRDAERACASQHARLASAEELRYAVSECYFSPCTRGWLYGGTVGTTVCNIVGGTLKAVDVRTENATEDTTHLDTFCIKDKGAPCGDPPSFPNARMQEHSEFEMGDELLYTCVPGYVMPSGHSAFSLLCDSCGEWYGLVQVCVKDETESHMDYEDKFTDSYGETEHQSEGPKEAHGEVHEEVHGAAYQEGKKAQEQQETSFNYEVEVEDQVQPGEQEGGGEVIEHDRKFEGAIAVGEKDEEQAAEDLIGHPRWEQERKKLVKSDAAAATEAPVSLLSQKHLFWFPSEAFQQEGHPASTNPVTQTTQRASVRGSEDSKEQESQESSPHHISVDEHDHDHKQDSYDDRDTNDRDDHDDSHHDDQDVHDDSHHVDQDDHDSHQDEDDHDDDSKHYIPAQTDEHYDHYDMGEHEDDRDHVRYSTQDYDDRDDTYHEHESYEDHEDVTDDHTDDDQEHPDSLEKQLDHDDHDDHDDHGDHDDSEEHYDPSEDDHNHDDLDEHNDHDSYDDHDSHDSHEDNDDGHQHVIFPIDTDEGQNVTQKGAGSAATTDETWLDGYPVAPEETEKGDSAMERVRPEDRERGTVVRTTDRPNEVEKPVPYTSLPEVPKSPTTDSNLEQEGVEEVWPGFILTAAPSSDDTELSNSPSYSDTLDYDTQQAAPTHSWLDDLTEHPFLNHGPAPPVQDGDIITGGIEEHTVHNLPGETGERGEVEGEMGEAICTGEDCPPHPPNSSSRGPTVAAIIVAVCVVAAAVIIGLWCYRRQQLKSSMYEMNGKGQSQTRQGQQIEMQQKV
ncbi:hypothetical protein PAMA_011512 [Pampus argenteus]